MLHRSANSGWKSDFFKNSTPSEPPVPCLLPMVRSTMQPLFRDVTDHVRNIQERIDSMREVLAFAFEASLLVGQAQETAVSKKLASWLAIIAVPTAVAGIYGMNFKYIPELQW